MTDANQQREPDYVDRALNFLDHLLDVFHDKVLRPILLAGRIIAYGFIILCASLILTIALTVGLLRILNVYAFAGHEWISYAILGVISLTSGLIIWRKRRPVTLRK